MQFNQFQIENLFFMDAVKNVIMKNGDFIKFLYSDSDCVMNSLYFDLPIEYTGVEKTFHKNKLVYDPYSTTNITAIRELYLVEKAILDYYEHTGKKPVHKISESTFQGNIYFGPGGGGMSPPLVPPEPTTGDKKKRLIVKFSGIWENATEYGITYKFIL